MRIIDSKDNKTLKYLKKLEKSRFRNSEGVFLIEGSRIVDQAIETQADIRMIIYDESYLNEPKNNELIDKINRFKLKADDKINGLKLKEDDKNNINYDKSNSANDKLIFDEIILKNGLFSKITNTKNPQGIAALCSINEKNTSKIIERTERSERPVLVLDRIQDPGNMGTIIRTADAAGIKDVYIVRGSVDIYNDKVLRSTMGSIFTMNFIVASEEEIISMLKVNCGGYKIVTTSLDTDVYYNEVKYDRKTAIVIGNEGSGVSDGFVESADRLVKIPMRGEAESLNVAVSAGIVIYHVLNEVI